jgi:K+-sensing histidine kinase KdpD
MKTSLLFFIKRIFAWALAFLVLSIFWNSITEGRLYFLEFGLQIAYFVWMIILVFILASHIRRVSLAVGEATLTSDKLMSRHRRQIELPMSSEEAYRMIEGAVRELPRAEGFQVAPDSLQIRALVARHSDPAVKAAAIKSGRPPTLFDNTLIKLGMAPQPFMFDQLSVVITPNGSTSSAVIVCEPTMGALADWFWVDQAANLENIEALTRAITRRVAEQRRSETASAVQTSNDKALAEAKLGLLHAQIEPHFLYNTLGSAKYLVRLDAAKAETILDNLISYLRHSLPRSEATPSTVGDELQRATAYLDILKIRMGERLVTHISVADSLFALPFPAMMLQTLVENAIKHGIEPKSGGGNIWIIANTTDSHLSVTVADDGRGLSASTDTKGTGIGLNNIRERLALAYGGAAAFELNANFPAGVAATIRLPLNQLPSPQTGGA